MTLRSCPRCARELAQVGPDHGAPGKQYVYLPAHKNPTTGEDCTVWSVSLERAVEVPKAPTLVHAKAVMARATQLCANAEPHDLDLALGQSPPCTRCILTAARQLAPVAASTSSSGSGSAGGADGVTGRVPGPPPRQDGGPTLNEHRSPAQNEGPAVRPAVTGQMEGTR